MARVLGYSRGSFRVATETVSSTVISISGGDGGGSSDELGDGILVTAFSFVDQEKSSIMQCFGNTNHIYAFGHDPEQSAFSVTFLVFMNAACADGDCSEPDPGFRSSGNMQKVVNWYKGVRVSNGSAVDATFDGVLLKGIVLNASVSSVEPEFNAVRVTVSGKSLYLH